MSRSPGTMLATIVVSGRTIDEAGLTLAFGREPTEVWRVKPSVAAQHPDLDRQEWRHAIEVRPSLSFSDAVDRLIEAFPTGVDAIGDYCRSHGLALSVHVRPRGNPRDFILGFDRPGSIQTLGRIAACFYVHIDDLGADGSEFEIRDEPPGSSDA